MNEYNNKTLTKHLTSGFVSAGGGFVLSALAAFAHISFLSKHLPPAEMGTYFLYFSFATLLSTIAALGLNDAITKYNAKAHRVDSEAVRSNNSRVLVIGLTSCIATALAVFLFAKSTIYIWFDIPWNQKSLTLFSLWVGLQAIQLISSGIFRSTHNVGKATFFGTTLKNILYLLLCVAAQKYYGTLNIEIVLTSVVLAVLINNVAAVLFRQKLKRPGIATNTTYLNHLDIIKLAIPLLANTLLVIAIGRIGLWTAGYNFEKDSVAIYGAALQLALLLTQPLLIINTLTMPLIADMFHNDTDHGRLEKVLRTTTSLVAWPFILFFLGLVIFGSDLLTIIFDKSYAQGYWVLVFLAAGQLSTLVVGPSGLILKMTNHHNFLVTINCVTGLITLVLSILAAQKYSIEGVAAVAMSTIIIKNIFVLHFTARKTRIFSAIFLRPSEIVDVFNHGMRTMRGKKRTNII